MENNKKKIAAMTAVLYYLQAEEAARHGVVPEKPALPAPGGDFWNFSSRQSQMMLRSMAQMRLFPGWKS